MKYNLSITLILISLFLVSQIVGLFLVNGSIQEIKTLPSGEVVIEHKETIIERPETEGGESFIFIIFGIAIATILMLIIIKLNLLNVWKFWFFIAVWMTIAISLSVYTDMYLAAAGAFILGLLKVLKPNPVIHNITEILIYAGIVIIFVPIFDVFWTFMLLLAISLYDIIAVRKTKHMVKMAMFLTKSKLFAGLSFPTGRPLRPDGSHSKKEVRRSAILGGGDIAFPLLFSGVVMENLITNGMTKLASFGYTLTITLCAVLSLSFLFWIAKEDKYYPAMPFLTTGCFIGYLIVAVMTGIF
jgi:presenilin-like A22 family membrane protease